MSTYPASRRPPTPPPPPEHDVAGRIGPDADAYDALADMFLGELAASPAEGRGRRDRPAPHKPASHDLPPASTVELLILGHLPVMAAAWASHYVRHAAGHVPGPVAALRLADDAAWLELLNARGTPAPARSLSAALRTAEAARHWIVRASAGREHELSRHQRIGRITLLTGCNEAATVDAYRALKQLASSTDALPPLRVAVLGGTAAACRQAADRVCDACHAFLELEVEAVTCPGAIGAGPAGVELYHGPAEADARLILDRISSPRPPQEHEDSEHLSRQPDEALDGEAVAEQKEPTGPEAAPADPAAARGPALTPAPTTIAVKSEEPAVPAVPRPSPEDLGLRPLPAKCPYEPSVQLALDDAGSLHLLVRPAEATQIDAAVRALSIVSAWASDHRFLLGASGDPLTIQRHLLTDSPREARRLLDTDIRVHLCASAERAQQGWILADLN